MIKKLPTKEPFTNDLLKKLFEESPIFKDNLPDTLRTNPSMVFIPLLALYTGANLSELTNLNVDDIQIEKEYALLQINNNKSSKQRTIPIALQLIELGFLDFVAYQKKQKEPKLFPDVKHYSDGQSSFSNTFTQYIRKYVTQEKTITFSSFRHLVVMKMKNATVPVHMINDLLGLSNARLDEFYSPIPIAEFKKVIDQSLYYELDLSVIKEGIAKVYK